MHLPSTQDNNHHLLTVSEAANYVHGSRESRRTHYRRILLENQALAARRELDIHDPFIDLFVAYELRVLSQYNILKYQNVVSPQSANFRLECPVDLLGDIPKVSSLSRFRSGVPSLCQRSSPRDSFSGVTKRK